MLREGRQTRRIILVAQIAAVMNDPKKIMLRMVTLRATLLVLCSTETRHVILWDAR